MTASTYVLIASQNLNSSVASVTFSSIPQTYTDLKLTFSARLDIAGVGSSALAYVYNGDNIGTGANYDYTLLTSNGVSALSLSGGGNNGQTYIYYTDTAGDTANTFATGDIYIPYYANSSYKKQSFAFHCEENNAASAHMSSTAGIYNQTSPVTSIKVGNFGGGNLIAGSSFYLYGIKNS
jgi:hypothetical protein